MKLLKGRGGETGQKGLWPPAGKEQMCTEPQQKARSLSRQWAHHCKLSQPPVRWVLLNTSSSSSYKSLQSRMTLWTLWTVAHQAPLSLGLSRQEYWSGLPFLTPRDLPDLGIEPESLDSPALAGGFFANEPPGKPERSLSNLSPL